MKTVFVDSGAFYAALAATDRHHQRARELLSRAQDQRWSLVTTNAVVYETHALLLNRAANGGTLSRAFLDAMQRGLARVERITEADESTAIDLIRAHRDKSYSLCDAMSFVVIERLGLGEAIAFEADFRSYGQFTVL